MDKLKIYCETIKNYIEEKLSVETDEKSSTELELSLFQISEIPWNINKN